MKYLEPMKLYHELLRLKTTGPLLGLTVVNKCVGISISDVSKKVASPLTIVVRTKRSIDSVSSEFQDLISSRSISGLVIGYPFKDKNKNPCAGVKVEHFVDKLSKTGKFDDMNYTFWEEGFTAKVMFEKLKREVNAKLFPLVPKMMTDEFAAFEILKEYLDFVNQNQDQTFQGKER